MAIVYVSDPIIKDHKCLETQVDGDLLHMIDLSPPPQLVIQKLHQVNPDERAHMITSDPIDKRMEMIPSEMHPT